MTQPTPPEKSPYHCRPSFEKLEERLAFSADGLLLANIDLADQMDQPFQPVEIRPMLDSVIQQSKLDYVVNEYGLDGSGQTVAVIDPGIAWDHVAFGSGYGGNHQVVGGWDFAENDSNPYDDGPAGYHGTHVAGIIGSNHTLYQGAAPGVDLVALRVFDDQGMGTIEWVEKALQWIHQHKDSFRNPITTVNLSLGTQWNANNVPNWATLEDEFQMLESSGIFISVAAGNSFQTYQSAGVSYPAASPHVVPVASHDADGKLSSFSQRNHRVLVAPGELMKSAVPGHLYGTDSTDRFLGSSGTSMAAPFVAGASTLLRQAFEFMGFSQIDQARLYQHFQQTSDKVYDPVTQANYNRINLQRAIDAIIGDDYANDRHHAFDIGAIGSNAKSMNGIIGGKSDVDWFKFKAGSTGEAIINLTGEAIDTRLFVAHTPFSVQGNQIRFQVVAGQEYQFSVESDALLGRYQFNARINPTVTTTNLGDVIAKTVQSQHVHGNRWYQITAGRDGILTTQAIFGMGNPSTQLELYDAEMRLVTQGTTNDFQTRLDAKANAGQTFFLKASGQNASFDLKITNLVNAQYQLLSIQGTSGNDQFQFDMRSGIKVTVNGTGYQLNSHHINQVLVEGMQGADQLKVHTGAGDQTVLRNGQVVVNGAQFQLTARHFYKIDILASGINDQVVFVDSAGNDSFYYTPHNATMTSGGFQLSASGQRLTQVLFSSGFDTVSVTGTQDNQLLTVHEDKAWFKTNTVGGKSQLFARGWDRLSADGGGGSNVANIHDTSAKDDFQLAADEVSRKSTINEVVARNFNRVNVTGGQPHDSVVIQGTSGNDRLVAGQDRVTMTNGEVTFVSKQFTTTIVDVIGSGGHDRAVLYDSSANDVVDANDYRTRMEGGGRTVVARGFASVDVYSVNGGHDVAQITGSAQADHFYCSLQVATISAAHFQVRFNHFNDIRVGGMSAADRAFVLGTTGNDRMHFAAGQLTLTNATSKLDLRGFGQFNVNTGGGFDIVEIDGFETGDQLIAHGNHLLAVLNETQVRIKDFTWLDARTAAGATVERDFGAVDFWFELHGNWHDVNASSS